MCEIWAVRGFMRWALEHRGRPGTARALRPADHRALELYIVRTAKCHDPDTFHRLRSIPGIGKVLALTLLYEIHDIHRFPSVQDFASYCRLVRCAKESAGKRFGTSGKKIGNVHLKWAFSEAAVLFLRQNPEGKKLLARLERKHRKGKPSPSWPTSSDGPPITCSRVTGYLTCASS